MIQRIIVGCLGLVCAYLLLKNRFYIQRVIGDAHFPGISTKNSVVLGIFIIIIMSILYMTDTLDAIIPDGLKMLF